MVKGLDPGTIRDIKALVRDWKTTQRVATDLARAPQLPHSSITGSITVYDDDGNVAAKVGRQDDGSYAPTVTLGPVPPRPTPAIVSDKNVGQVAITWDGHYVDDPPAPLDFAMVEVHITRDPDAELDLGLASATRWASIVDPGGGTATVKLDAGTWYAWLVARSQADQTSEPSEPVEFEVSSVLDRDDIIDVIEQAGTGNRVYYATTPPSQDGVAAGDTWRQRELHPGTNIVAEWAWDGSDWVSQQITSSVITNLDAGKITAGTIQAAVSIGTSGSIVAGDPAGANAAMTADGFRAHAITDEGEAYASTRLGTGADDALEIIAAPGEPPVASINSGGIISGAAASFAGDVQVAGIPILGQTFDSSGPAGYFDFTPRGMVRQAKLLPAANGTWPSATNSVVAWFQFDAYANRIYHFELPWVATAAVVGTATIIRSTMQVRQEVASSPMAAPAEPTNSSPLVFSRSNYQPAVTSATVSEVMSFAWQPWTGESTEPRAVAVAVTLFPGSATFTPSSASPAAWIATITDIGPSDPAKMVEASPAGSQAARTYTSTWVASSSRAWLNSGAQVTESATVAMRQGQNTAAPLGEQTHSAMVFNGNAVEGEVGSSISSALSGAVLRKVEVWVFAVWWGDTKNNQIYLQPFTGNTLPATRTGVVSGTRFIFPYPGKGMGQWMTLPSSWFSTTNRGVAIGPLDPLAMLAPGTSGRFAGATYATTAYRPKLRLTYTK